jgi:hypothetical protein
MNSSVGWNSLSRAGKLSPEGPTSGTSRAPRAGSRWGSAGRKVSARSRRRRRRQTSTSSFIRKHDNEVESFPISIYIRKFSGDLVRHTAN